VSPSRFGGATFAGAGAVAGGDQAGGRADRRDDQKPGNVIANDQFASPTDLEMTGGDMAARSACAAAGDAGDRVY
jgi:hypothetical protein